MKRRLLACMLALSLGLTACISGSSSKVALAARPVYPGNSLRALREEYPLTGELTRTVQDFSIRSAALALGGTEKNALYSPVSLWFALALCAEGAGGDTRAALLRALGLPGEAALGESAKALFLHLYTDSQIGSLKLANSLWLPQGFPVNQDFLDRAAEQFYAASYRCDFADPAAGAAMGDWLSAATGGLLGGTPQETDPETLVTLFSAIYYTDQWIDEFHAEQNTTGEFHNLDGTVSQTEYMNRTSGSYTYYYYGDGYLAASLRLAYGTMYLILPDEGRTPGDLLADSTTLAELLCETGEHGYGEVILQLPKFEVSDSLDLESTVTGLGAGCVFDPGADFSALSPDDLYVSYVQQEATLSLDEKGVTAAAYTEIGLNGGTPLPDSRAELILDRPFLFVITSNSVPLFVGAVNTLA